MTRIAYLNGVSQVLTDEEVAALRPATQTTLEEIDAERDRRINAGFSFQDVAYQTTPDARENIAGAGQLAFRSIVLAGARADDLRWHGGETDFVWIAADNSRVAMDAPTVMAFSAGAAAAKSRLIFLASDLKARLRAGEVITDPADPIFWTG